MLGTEKREEQRGANGRESAPRSAKQQWKHAVHDGPVQSQNKTPRSISFLPEPTRFSPLAVVRGRRDKHGQ